MGESVAEYTCRLERLFQAAYGHDGLSVETRQTLLYSQLEEGLMKYGLIKRPGADSYTQLCIAPRHEEKRLNELSRRQQYLKDVGKKGDAGGRSQQNTTNKPSGKRRENRGEPRQCYVCGDTDHLVWNCKKKTKRNTDAGTKMVKCKEDPLDFLLLDSDVEKSGVNTVQIQDKGSKPREVLVDIQATGVIDSSADIIIMGAELFKKVASVARLKKSAFKKPDKTPYTYDHQPFSLDGKLELDITFDNCILRST